MNVKSLQQIIIDFENYVNYIKDFNLPGRFLSQNVQIGIEVRKVFKSLRKDTQNEIIRQCEKQRCNLELAKSDEKIGMQILFPNGIVNTNTPLCNSHRHCILDIIVRETQREVEYMRSNKNKRVELKELFIYFKECYNRKCDPKDEKMQNHIQALLDLDDSEINQYIKQIENAQCEWNFLPGLLHKPFHIYWEQQGEKSLSDLLNIFSEVENMTINNQVNYEEKNNMNINQGNQVIGNSNSTQATNINQANQVIGNSNSTQATSSTIYRGLNWVCVHWKLSIGILIGGTCVVKFLFG